MIIPVLQLILAQPQFCLLPIPLLEHPTGTMFKRGKL